MDFEDFARQYNRPMPFCPWQGDMLYEKEIQFNLMKLETLCKEFCDPTTADYTDDPEGYVTNVKKQLEEVLLFLGRVNERTIYFGRLLLKRMNNPHPQERFIEVRETVWWIFCHFAEQKLFNWH